MYPSMLERVASVIKNLEGCYDGCKHCNMIAKAAIQAMREPTEEMKKGRMKIVVEEYQSMIDVALDERK